MEGGCHCGHIRYALSAKPFAADFCHCRDCQQTTGAPVGAWMDFHAHEVSWLKGAQQNMSLQPMSDEDSALTVARH